MTKNHDIKWDFVLGGLETQLHDILWAVHDGQNRGRSEGEEIIGEFLVKVAGRGPSDACFSRTYACVCEALALTEPEGGFGL